MPPPRRQPLAAAAMILAVLAALGAHAADPDLAPAAWKSWTSIDAAIAIRELDGPEDIIEKAEIIEDRVDALARERERVKAEETEIAERTASLREQRQALREIADLQFGGDVRARQRLRDLAERIRGGEAAVAARRASAAEIETERSRLAALAEEYRRKAETLRKREGKR
ncbi:hypothetical protein K8I61_07625 [bacterium]|nr:hypothetical protein [bacterium]